MPVRRCMSEADVAADRWALRIFSSRVCPPVPPVANRLLANHLRWGAHDPGGVVFPP
jgi:hypothetical protein